MGNAVIAVAAEPTGLVLKTSRGNGVDVDAAPKEGRLIELDVIDTLSSSYGQICRSRWLPKIVGDVILKVSKRAQGEQPPCTEFAEDAFTLLAEANAEVGIG